MNDDSFPEEDKYSTYPIFKKDGDDVIIYKDEDDNKLIKTMPGEAYNSMAADLEKKSVLDDLSKNTHSLWGQKVAEKYCKPFAFVPTLHVWADDPDHPKGMHLHDPEEGPLVGVTSEELIDEIAVHCSIDVSEANRMLGRGFRVRRKAELIEYHLGLTDL